MFFYFQFTASVREKSLEYIDDSFIETGDFLKGISSKKLECLKVFTKCQSIVNWIGNETKGGLLIVLNYIHVDDYILVIVQRHA